MDALAKMTRRKKARAGIQPARFLCARVKEFAFSIVPAARPAGL
jgi:hypothetical protein